MRSDPATLVIRPLPESVKIARDFVATTIGSWGIEDDVPCLVVSELVTNALRASSGDDHIVVRAYMNAGRPMIEVWDRAGGVPEARGPDPREESGRGLQIVSHLVEEWGTRPLPEGGKIVFAELRPR